MLSPSIAELRALQLDATAAVAAPLGPIRVALECTLRATLAEFDVALIAYSRRRGHVEGFAAPEFGVGTSSYSLWYHTNCVQVLSVCLQQQLVQVTRAHVDAVRKKISFPFLCSTAWFRGVNSWVGKFACVGLARGRRLGRRCRAEGAHRRG